MKNEMGWTCSAYEERRGVYTVLLGNMKERDHLGDTGVDGRIILRWIFRRGFGRYGLDGAGSG